MKNISKSISVIPFLFLLIQVSHAAPTNIAKDTLNQSIKNFIEKTINSLIPKDSLISLIDFSKKINYNFEKGGLQEVYIPSHFDGEETFFSVANLSSNEFKTNNLEASNLETETLNTININTEGISSPSGISVLDSFDNQKYCVTVYRGTVVVNQGSC
jgi:hypothetical protein